jgi:hypothetical protein
LLNARNHWIADGSKKQDDHDIGAPGNRQSGGGGSGGGLSSDRVREGSPFRTTPYRDQLESWLTVRTTMESFFSTIKQELDLWLPQQWTSSLNNRLLQLD